MIKSGKASINPMEWVGKSKEEFFAAVRGHLAHDKEEIWNQIQKINGDASIGGTSKQGKKSNDKRVIDSTESE